MHVSGETSVELLKKHSLHGQEQGGHEPRENPTA